MTNHFVLFSASVAVYPGSLPSGNMFAVCQSEAVLPQQLAHLPAELSLTSKGTNTTFTPIKQAVCPWKSIKFQVDLMFCSVYLNTLGF